MTRPAVLISCAVWLSLLMAGCATDGHDDGAWKGLFKGSGKHETVVSEAQACAIGYDLARAIHDTVSLRRTVIVAPTRSSPCEHHALNYLRLAGFRIDQKAAGDPSINKAQQHAGVSLDIELAPLDNGGFAAGDGVTVSAVATLGGDLRIARSYRPVRTGVIAEGPISIQHLNPDTYSTRPASGRRGGAS